MMTMTETERMNLVVQKLMGTSFFKMPASSKYHSNHEGGLFEHSTHVWLRLRQITDKMNLKWDHPSSPFVIAMLHDACKIDAYFYNYDYKCWERNPDHPEGHGDLSLKIIDQLGIELTDQEKTCIRWHMGAFDEKDNWSKFTAIIQSCPNAVWTHVADLLASQSDEVMGKVEGVRKVCCICGEPLRDGEYGNNPSPLCKDGVCCDKCNSERVIPARLIGLGGKC